MMNNIDGEAIIYGTDYSELVSQIEDVLTKAFFRDRLGEQYLMLDNEKCEDCKYCNKSAYYDGCSYMVCKKLDDKWVVKIDKCPIEEKEQIGSSKNDK